MKPSQQRLSEARRQQHEEIISRFARRLFQRVPGVSGFWLGPDLKASELTVFPWPGNGAGHELYEKVMQLVVELTEGHPEVVECMRGRTFARTLH